MTEASDRDQFGPAGAPRADHVQSTHAPSDHVPSDHVPSDHVLSTHAPSTHGHDHVPGDHRHDHGSTAPDAGFRHDAGAWDERYLARPDQLWSGNVNGSLAVEAEGLPAGRALDVGCGEGADAIWLAQRGWTVTGVDISPVAIERARRAAEDAGVDVDLQCADLMSHPLGELAYDLVSLQYAAFPRSGGAAAVRSILRAVAPGGTVLVVGHDLANAAIPRPPGFRPAEFFLLDDIAGMLGDDFEVLVHETRPRPSPPAGSHHVDDVVLRARRTTPA